MVHTSIHHGMQLGKAASFSFRHNDLGHLEKRLKVANGIVWVVVESVYSMDGDFAPLEEIVMLCERHGAQLIVDEAHYYRNKDGDSLRVKTASGFFGDKETGRIADRVIMLTATPTHTSLTDIENIISYFTDVKALLVKDDLSSKEQKTRSEYLLKAIALRRYRRLAGRIKYQYREEQAIEADFESNPESELFFAIYQKRLVQHLKKANNRVFFGYLEGFESFSPSKDNVEDSIDEERKESTDFSKQIDTDILRKLSKVYYGFYGSKPSHPKYDRMIELIINPSENYWSKCKQKNLIFVRRIPSLKEISQRIINNYDELFWKKILQAWNLYHTYIDFSKFQKKTTWTG